MRRWLAWIVMIPMAQGIVSSYDDRAWLRFEIKNQQLQSAVAEAVMGAARRLRRPRCERLLSEFFDARGRTLQENLRETGMNAEEYLLGLGFRDGSRDPTCGPSVAAFTKPGSRTVFICEAPFVRNHGTIRQIDSEIVILHELLHTLGLGENGRHPNSAVITHRVSMACKG